MPEIGCSILISIADKVRRLYGRAKRRTLQELQLGLFENSGLVNAGSFASYGQRAWPRHLDRHSQNTDVLLKKARAATSQRSKGLHTHQPLWFSGFRFQGIGCGKFPIPVRLGARSAAMQFTNFLDRGSTSRTRDGQDLFRGKFPNFHPTIMHLPQIETVLFCTHL